MLDGLYAFRVFDKNLNPCISALQFDDLEIVQHFTNRPQQKGLSVQDVIKGRISTETAIRQEFLRKGGYPATKYCLYFAIGNHVLDYILSGFNNPAYIKIPLPYFADKPVSFLYGNASIAFFRNDHHETKRKVYLYDEMESVIEQYGLDVEYGNTKSYIEMQLWDPRVIDDYTRYLCY